VAATASAAAGTIVQQSPTSGTSTVSGSNSFTDTLNVTGNTGPVTFLTTAGTGGLNVDPGTGDVTTTGPLAAGSYNVSGTDADGSADTGSWTYSLVVGTITQQNPTSGATTASGSNAFTDTLNVTGNNGAVTFTTTSGSSGLNVDADTGDVTTTGPLTAGSYSVAGTDSDGNGDSGNWSYTLTVTGAISQTSPTSGTTSTNSSSAFQPGTIATSGNVGPVTFVTTVANSGLNVSGSGVISTTGTLAPGPYAVSGTDSDTNGDTGTWSYTLTVTAPATSPSSIVQTSLTSGSTTTPDSSTFVPPALAVENNQGAVTFTVTTSNPGLSVTPSGIISVVGSLPAGTYTVSGTDRDTSGDTGTWKYTLTVTDTFATVTFEANLGKGDMAPEKQDQPSPLTINTFTRTHYTFTDWNTSPKGTGTDYANGVMYTFTSDLTLYAQWKLGKVPTREVTFMANGGKGSMAVEYHNTATALSPVRFTRDGYTFVDWNTKAKGSGTTYGAGATYSFKDSLTLFAQWKKIPKKPAAPRYTVTFNANGGHGAMASQTAKSATALDQVAFTRADYTFEHWNTKANGSGNDYANRAVFSFAANVTLYAQWHRNKVVVPPAIHASGTIGPFAHKSKTITPTIESQVKELAAKVKADHDTKISLVGYGDALSKADQLNESLWAANFTLSQNRANAVAASLRRALTALGVTSYNIKAVGNGSTFSGKSKASASHPYGDVTAELT
jgi:outer membrane protein OmpA-like peptidoglycan-associated protein